MSVDDKLWVLDKAETFALSGWLTQAETIRREMNRLVFSDWDAVKSEKALSKSILRRSVAYWHTYKALAEKEAMGVHGGTYAEDLIASLFRARASSFRDDIEILQNRWDKTAKREADICALHDGKLLLVIEVKSALTNEEWKKSRVLIEDYKKLAEPPTFWIVAVRADGLNNQIKEEIKSDSRCCVLSDQGRKVVAIPERKLEIWQPIEPWFDALIESLKPAKAGTAQ